MVKLPIRMSSKYDVDKGENFIWKSCNSAPFAKYFLNYFIKELNWNERFNETLLLIITSSIQLQNRSFHSKNDNKLDKNEKRPNFLYVNWYFECVGVCFSWPNRCLDNFRSACDSFDICLNTQGSPALHCTYDKDRLELSFNVMQMDNGIRYCKIQGNSL